MRKMARLVLWLWLWVYLLLVVFLVALHVSLNGLIVPGPGSFVSMRSKNVFCKLNVCSCSASKICCVMVLR